MDAADDQLLLDDAPVQDPEVAPGAGLGGAQNPPRRASFLTKAFTELACDRSQVTNELTAFQVRLPGFYYCMLFRRQWTELQIYFNFQIETIERYPERLFDR